MHAISVLVPFPPYISSWILKSNVVVIIQFRFDNVEVQVEEDTKIENFSTRNSTSVLEYYVDEHERSLSRSLISDILVVIPLDPAHKLVGT